MATFGLYPKEEDAIIKRGCGGETMDLQQERKINQRVYHQLKKKN
jgi:hypothetical protein